MKTELRVLAIAAFLTVVLTACGGGSSSDSPPAVDMTTDGISVPPNDNGGVVVDDENTTGGTPDDGNTGGSVDTENGVPVSLIPTAGAAIPVSLNQRMACYIGGSSFSLLLNNTGVAEYSDSDGGFASGSYGIEQGLLVVRLDTGDVATSVGQVVAGDLLIGAKFQLLDGSVVDCIAREHSAGDRLAEDVAVRCGRRNITGEEENTFTLYESGASMWENVFELGFDTTFETRIGTYLYDQASNSVLMVYKEFDSDELLFFGGVGTTESFLMTVAPESGSGSFTPREQCGYF